MKRKNLFYILPVVLAFGACSDDVDTPMTSNEISLNASVGEIESRAEAKPYLGSSLATYPLKAWVWFSEDANVYGNTEMDNMTHLPCRTTLTFDGAPQFAYDTSHRNLKYGTDGQEVHCLGFYPADDVWNTTDGKTATATIDGTTDLMFAPRISGKWGEPMKLQTYQHVQTWVKVCICATSQEAVEAWGKITAISIETQTSVSVDVSSGTITYSTDGKMPVMSGTNGKSLHTTMQEIGSVFCSPATAYTVNVTIGGKTISKEISVTPLENVTLSSANDARGKLVILTLYFNEFSMIEGVCTLNAWDAQNEDLYMKQPVQNE